MNNFVEFWDSLGYNRFFLVLLVITFAGHAVYMIYKAVLLMVNRKQGVAAEGEGVSVIITCSNKAELLEKNLEAFLMQDYPLFEVIVVDECSEDDTQDLLSDLQQKYPHLKTSRIFPGTKFRCTKKIAINIGVLAAQYDILLFSEINCVPDSKQWIRCMQSYFEPNTAVVIGYSNYEAGNKGTGLPRYFRFLWFWKMLLLVRNGFYSVGNGYNMGYRKKYYLEKRGYTGNTQEYLGYDTEMVKVLSQKGKVKVVKDPESRVSIEEISPKIWENDFSYYYATRRRWPLPVRMRISLDFVVECVFYLLAFYFIFWSQLHKYVLIPLVLTFLIDFMVINLCLKHLGQKKLFITSLTVNTFGFIYRWYYSIYSIFTSRKWR